MSLSPCVGITFPVWSTMNVPLFCVSMYTTALRHSPSFQYFRLHRGRVEVFLLWLKRGAHRPTAPCWLMRGTSGWGVTDVYYWNWCLFTIQVKPCPITCVFLANSNTKIQWQKSLESFLRLVIRKRHSTPLGLLNSDSTQLDICLYASTILFWWLQEVLKSGSVRMLALLYFLKMF